MSTFKHRIQLTIEGDLWTENTDEAEAIVEVDNYTQLGQFILGTDQRNIAQLYVAHTRINTEEEVN